MKRKLILMLLILGIQPVLLQAGTEYLFFGDDRPYQPGLELMNSIYAVNPAKTAEAVHNSIAMSTIIFPSSAAETNHPFGAFYSLTIPNFSIVNITQSTIAYDQAETGTEITRDLLGLQVGLGLGDFVNSPNFKVAGGLALYKFRDIQFNDPETTSQSINLDLGVTLNLFGFNLDVLVKNFLAFHEENTSFFGPSWDLAGRLGSKIILDVDFIFSLATARNYDLYTEGGKIDFIAGINFIRYFLSNSLRTGVGLEAFFDTDNEANQIPVVRYQIAVSYTPLSNVPDFLDPDKKKSLISELGNAGVMLLKLLQNLTLNFGTTMMVNNISGSSSLVPVVTLGVTKFY